MQTDELLAIRESLLSVLGRVDQLLAKNTLADSPENSSPNYRRRAGGPLNEAGEMEITRRFESGHTDSQIALSMGISLTGVSKRRGMWRKSKQL
jgi:DNA-binding NarL/FixJ family response regulator